MVWEESLSKEAREEVSQRLGNISRESADILISQLEKLFMPRIKQRIQDRQFFMGTEGQIVDFLDAARDYLVGYLDHDAARGFVDAYAHLVPVGQKKCPKTTNPKKEEGCPMGLNGIKQAEEIYHELQRDKYLLSKEAGYDIGEKAAEKDFLEKHNDAWATGRRIAIETLICPYRDCCDKGKRVLSNALEYLKTYNSYYSDTHPILSEQTTNEFSI